MLNRKKIGMKLGIRGGVKLVYLQRRYYLSLALEGEINYEV